MNTDDFNPKPHIAALLGETKSQIGPENLPDELTDELRERYPPPWSADGSRGNGHLDVFAANGAYVAHVYCWDAADGELLTKKLASINASA